MIAVIDYGAGNIQSVVKALKFIGCDCIVTNKKEELLKADGAIMPGVGSFGDSMDSMIKTGAKDAVLEFIERERPFLGICLGLQLLFPKSEESPNAKGLGLLDGTITKIPADTGLKIPHMGWNSLKILKHDGIFKGIEGEPYVYFVHSYFLTAQDQSIVSAQTEYGVKIDASVRMLVAVRAMKQLGRPTQDVLAVTMPCFGTTHRTRSNAEILCDELGVTFQEIPIARTVHSHFADIGQDEAVLDVTYENCQARVRTLELMDLANRTGGLVVGTGDLSELALGWATYNGDHMSMYGVNADVPKTLVRHIVRYEAEATENAALRAVLLDILDTPVSPELLPANENGEIAQQTESLVGPYELHDFYLYYVLRFGFGPAKIYRLARRALGDRYPDDVLLHWLKNFYRRFFAQQFKRSCLPDGPKIGSITLSPRGDWRMPSDACAAVWQAELDQLR